MKTPQTKTEKKEDEVFTSKNHSKSVRFRIRLQQQKEAEQEILDLHQGIHYLTGARIFEDAIKDTVSTGDRLKNLILKERKKKEDRDQNPV